MELKYKKYNFWNNLQLYLLYILISKVMEAFFMLLLTLSV